MKNKKISCVNLPECFCKYGWLCTTTPWILVYLRSSEASNSSSDNSTTASSCFFCWGLIVHEPEWVFEVWWGSLMNIGQYKCSCRKSSYIFCSLKICILWSPRYGWSKNYHCRSLTKMSLHLSTLRIFSTWVLLAKGGCVFGNVGLFVCL